MILKLIFISYLSCGINLVQVQGQLNNNLLVEITNGWIQGFENYDYYGFRGIPYAEPPIGENRFKSPKPYNQKWTEIYNATKNNITCAQLNPGQFFQNYTIVGSEDCLYLNVYVPKLDESIVSTKNQSLPVMIYIHNGAFTYGSGNYLKERTLMRSKKFILVTFNYRLGPFGFLSTDDDIITGNMGLKDQRLAIKWVKENIEKFGGNSNQIILTGLSAGGVSVDLQTMQPDSENLIKVAVAFSGSSLNPWSFKFKPMLLAKNLAKYVGCKSYRDGNEIYDCFKEHRTTCILEAFQSLINLNKNGIQSFGPVMESNSVKDAIITKHPREVLKNQLPSKIPYLSSFTAQEGAVITLDLFRALSNGKIPLQHFKRTPLKYFHWILYHDGFRPTKLSRQRLIRILSNYNLKLPINETDFHNLNRLFTDQLFKKGIKESLVLRQKNSQIPVYSYVYDNPPMLNIANLISNRMDLNFGTTHGDDVFLFLNSPLRNMLVFREDELKMSEKFIEMLREFVRTGWFCHFDDDNYVNVPRLIRLLDEYNPAVDWYLGKPSISSPLEIHLDSKNSTVPTNKKITFWFATGGAGFCLSRALTLKMQPIAGDGKFISIGDKIRFPDDVTMGFIIEHLLKVPLTVIDQFHSHLEPMEFIRPETFSDQVSFSYAKMKNNEWNVIKIDNGFDLKTDPKRFYSIHCHLFPYFSFCPR